jgi:chemotaxis protein MotB
MRASFRTSSWCLAAAVAAVVLGCGPSQEELDQERAKVQRLESQLADARREREATQARLQELGAQNAALQERLTALGASLEEARGEHQSAQERITEMRRALEELRERERQARERLSTFRNLLSRFQSLIESGQLRVRIVRNRMVVELPEGILFASGKAKLKDEGEEALAEVAGVLKDIEDRDFQIAGHTDNVPIRTRRFPSNWELSAKRAVNVTRYLIEQGMKKDRLSAAGYADTQPVASNRTAEGRQQNRRIEIVLVPNLDELPDLSRLEDLSESAED